MRTMMRVLLPHSPRVFQPGPHGTQNTPLDLNPPTYVLGGLLRSPGHMVHNCPQRDLAPTESTTAIDATSGDRDMTHSGSRLVGVRGLTDCCENPGYGARESVLGCSERHRRTLPAQPPIPISSSRFYVSRHRPPLNHLAVILYPPNTTPSDSRSQHAGNHSPRAPQTPRVPSDRTGHSSKDTTIDIRIHAH